MRRTWLLTLALAALHAGAARADIATVPTAPPALAGRFADAADPHQVAAGRQIYRNQCAHCHGRRLEGQALWQVQDALVHQRAPALDDTGHAWQHSDADLFDIVSSGRMAGQPAGLTSRMPAASPRLDDLQILQVVAFIKARWTLGVRVAQATLNPDFAGMPAGADEVAWTLPPNCSSNLQQWRADTGQ